MYDSPLLDDLIRRKHYLEDHLMSFLVERSILRKLLREIHFPHAILRYQMYKRYIICNKNITMVKRDLYYVFTKKLYYLYTLH